MRLMGVDLAVPDHSTWSRRQAGLAVDWFPQQPTEPDPFGGGFDRVEGLW